MLGSSAADGAASSLRTTARPTFSVLHTGVPRGALIPRARCSVPGPVVRTRRPISDATRVPVQNLLCLLSHRHQVPHPAAWRPSDSNHSVPGVQAHVLLANYTDAACLRRVAHPDCCFQRACSHADYTFHPAGPVPTPWGPSYPMGMAQVLDSFFFRARGDSIPSACKWRAVHARRQCRLQIDEPHSSNFPILCKAHDQWREL
jgi:hypothetical protein